MAQHTFTDQGADSARAVRERARELELPQMDDHLCESLVRDIVRLQRAASDAAACVD